MNLRNIATIFRKDTLDAVRDGRILVAILIPFALAFSLNVVYSDEPETLSPTVAHTDEAASLVNALETNTGDINFSFLAGNATEVRDLVETQEADAGVVVPLGFEGSLETGQPLEITLVLPEEPSPEGTHVATALDPAVRALAGQPAPAEVLIQRVSAGGDGNVLSRIDLADYFVLQMVVFLIILVSMFAVPVILAEETEKKTLDALLMAASYREVIAAKALVGLVYVAVAASLMLALTRLPVENPLAFSAAVRLLSVTLIGFGLLIGGLFKNANQLNTWAGVLLMPVMVPAFLVGFPDLPEWGETILSAIPISQAVRLMINATSGEAHFPEPELGAAVIITWGLAVYGLLLWSLHRRQAQA